ncbi:MAG: hypothetical protein ACI9VR_003651, partial [Cognaticolwellia sp.]
DPRRADRVAWYLVQAEKMAQGELRQPGRVSYRDLARVHAPEVLESLGDPVALALSMGLEAGDVVGVELAHCLRVVCGGTLEACREALRSRGPTLNLEGGWLRAGPKKGQGIEQLNDVAVAIAALRAEGFRGRITVLSVGTARLDALQACLGSDERLWMGRIDSDQEGELWLADLDRLLATVPRSALSIVVSGSEDSGRLGLEVLRKRDRHVDQALEGRARVLLPGGGGGAQAWRALAGTALAVGLRTERPVAPDFSPMRAHFADIAKGLKERELAEDDLSFGIAEELGERSAGDRIMGFYTAEGVELALYEYGVLDHLQRLGFARFRVALDAQPLGSRIRLFGTQTGTEELLVECTVSSETVNGEPYIFVHWLNLRNPVGHFSSRRPRLPGQDAPGLGLAPEMAELLRRMARRLGMAGLAMQPSWFHVAYSARHDLRFETPELQGRFVALIRDLRGVPLGEVTRAISGGRVQLNGAPYIWDAERMTSNAAPDPEEVERIAGDSHFTLREPVQGAPAESPGDR